MSAEPLLELRASDGDCQLGVRAQPGARRSAIAGLWNGKLKISVRAPAEDGRANEELLDVLAQALGLPRRALKLAQGERSRLKRVHIAAPLEQVRARLLALLAQGPS